MIGASALDPYAVGSADAERVVADGEAVDTCAGINAVRAAGRRRSIDDEACYGRGVLCRAGYWLDDRRKCWRNTTADDLGWPTVAAGGLFADQCHAGGHHQRG